MVKPIDSASTEETAALNNSAPMPLFGFSPSLLLLCLSPSTSILMPKNSSTARAMPDKHSLKNKNRSATVRTHSRPISGAAS